MFRFRQNSYILRAIVEVISINMMDFLYRKQTPSYFRLCNFPVECFAIYPMIPGCLTIFVSKRKTAFRATEIMLCAVNIGGFFKKHNTAPITGNWPLLCLEVDIAFVAAEKILIACCMRSDV